MKILTMSFDKNNGFYYEQLYQYIKNEIINENLKTNTKLPSKRRLSAHLNISQNTVEMAYNQLIDEGYVYSVARSGYYVSDISNIIILSDVSIEDILIREEKAEYRYDFKFNGVDSSSNLKKYIKRCLKIVSDDLDDEIFNRSTGKGLLDLRKSISKYLYNSRGFLADPENIIISYRTDDLINTLLILLDKDPVFAVENPGYKGISRSLDKYGIEYRPIELNDDGMNIELIPNDIDIVSITPSHQFPTGIIYPIKQRMKILNWAMEGDRFILEDDYDSEFRYTGATIPSLKSFDKGDRVIYIGNFSKSISSSFKTSYMVLPKSLSKGEYNSPVSYINQKLLSVFIDEGYFEKHLNFMRSLYKKKRDKMVSKLNSYDVIIRGQEAGMHLICDFGKNYEKVINNAEKYKIKIYPIKDYYETQTDDKRMLLGYSSIDIDDIDNAISLLFK
ncbi:MAG: PLP-dependent aminotransferase family protein [Tissierellia bacterium]|nr:PLP-dependent aminotransferase family protein [Tissierellia bacterium]